MTERASDERCRNSGSARWPISLAAIALTYLVCVVFFPILGFPFVDLDVDEQIVHNPHIQGLTGENLRHIFTSRCKTSYYPVRTLTYAIDYEIWGLNPASFKLINGLKLTINGFKLTNGLIHLANVLLVFWLILRLFRHLGAAHGPPRAWWDVSVAAFSAGIFAVHPVVVQPVTWVAGREELLMTLGALGCIHFHITARRLGEAADKTRWALACYIAAAFCCAVACLSNAVAAVIPLLIVTWDVLMLPQPKLWRILSGTAPLWAIGVATIVVKKLCSESQLVAAEAPTFSTERLMLVLNVYWLNLKTLVWPTELAVLYEWIVPGSFLETGVILGAVAMGLTCVILWKLRRRKPILFGLFWFGVALAPSSQIMPHHIHRADRYLYLPLVGLAVAVAMGFRPLRNVLNSRVAVAGVIAAGLLGLLWLDIVSADQVQIWRDSLSLWEHCVTVAPKNPVGHRCLADNLTKAAHFDQAIPHYVRALKIEPGNIEAMNNFALYLATYEDEELRDYKLAVKLAEKGYELTKGKDPDLRRTLATAYTNLATSLELSGQSGAATRYYDKAIEMDPGYEVAFFRLAWLLATSPNKTLRNPEKAVRLAERGRRLVEHLDALRLSVLAAAYAEARRFDEAVGEAKKALKMAETAGNRALIDELRRQLKLYQNRSPYRDAP